MEAERPAKPAKRRPLWDRMYVQPHLTELVLMVGYKEIALEEAREKIKSLIEKHGKEKIVAGSEELFTTDKSTVNLTAAARHLAWPLLGPPPEYKPTDMIAEIMARGERLKADPKPAPTKKPRRKKAASTMSVPSAPGNSNGMPHGLMQQFREAKERHPGMLLLFRVGDFFELFDQDAETAAKLLGLTLTTRDKTI